MARTNSFCTFYLEEHFFGVQTELVKEILRYQQLTRVPMARREVRGIMNLRGQIVTAIDLRTRLGLPGRPEDQQPMNVVLMDGGGMISLLVDRIGDVVDVEDALFEPPPETLRGIARELIVGAFKLKHQLLLILDAEKVVTLEA